MLLCRLPRGTTARLGGVVLSVLSFGVLASSSDAREAVQTPRASATKSVSNKVGPSSYATPKTSEFAARLQLLEFAEKDDTNAKRLAPLVNEMLKKHYPIQRVERAGDGEALFKQYGVKTTPTFVLLVDGAEYERVAVKGESVAETRTRLLRLFQRGRDKVAAEPRLRVKESTQVVALPKKGLIFSASEPRPNASVTTRAQVPSSAPNAASSSLATLVQDENAEKLSRQIGHTRLANATAAVFVERDPATAPRVGTGVAIHYNAEYNEALFVVSASLFDGIADVMNDSQVDVQVDPSVQSEKAVGQCVYCNRETGIAFVAASLDKPIVPASFLPKQSPAEVGEIAVEYARDEQGVHAAEHEILAVERRRVSPDGSATDKGSTIYDEYKGTSSSDGSGCFVVRNGRYYFSGICVASRRENETTVVIPVAVVSSALLSNRNLAVVYRDQLSARFDLPATRQEFELAQATLSHAAAAMRPDPQLAIDGKAQASAPLQTPDVDAADVRSADGLLDGSLTAEVEANASSDAREASESVALNVPANEPANEPDVEPTQEKVEEPETVTINLTNVRSKRDEGATTISEETSVLRVDDTNFPFSSSDAFAQSDAALSVLSEDAQESASETTSAQNAFADANAGFEMKLNADDLAQSAPSAPVPTDVPTQANDPASANANFAMKLDADDFVEPQVEPQVSSNAFSSQSQVQTPPQAIAYENLAEQIAQTPDVDATNDAFPNDFASSVAAFAASPSLDDVSPEPTGVPTQVARQVEPQAPIEPQPQVARQVEPQAPVEPQPQVAPQPAPTPRRVVSQYANAEPDVPAETPRAVRSATFDPLANDATRVKYEQEELKFEAALEALRKRALDGAEIICIVNWSNNAAETNEPRETEVVRLPRRTATLDRQSEKRRVELAETTAPNVATPSPAPVAASNIPVDPTATDPTAQTPVPTQARQTPNLPIVGNQAPFPADPSLSPNIVSNGAQRAYPITQTQGQTPLPGGATRNPIAQPQMQAPTARPNVRTNAQPR